MTPLGQAAGRKNLAKFLGIDMRAGSTGGLMMVMVMMVVNDACTQHGLRIIEP